MVLPTFTLGELIELKIEYAAPVLKQTAVEASQEADLLTVLEELALTWEKKNEFEIVSYKESKDVFIFGAVDEWPV